MENPFQSAPRSVQWAVVMLAALPVFDTIVALNVMPAELWASQWPARLPSIVIQLTIAAGLLYGINIIRLLFIASVLFMVGTDIFAWSQLGVYSMSLVASLTPRLIQCVAFVLCVLPDTNRYFAGKHEPPAESEPATVTKSTRHFSKIILLLLVLILGLVVVQRFGPLLEDASFLSSEHLATRSRIMQGTGDLAISNNLSMLATASNQYFLEQSQADTAGISDLVGPGKYITKLVLWAGEKYPEVIRRDVNPVAVLPDENIISYDSTTSRTTRHKPLPSAPKK
jgi:hypothetical protein